MTHHRGIIGVALSYNAGVSTVLNIAAYRFVELADLATLQQQLLARARAAALKGTVLLVVRKRQGQARGYRDDIGFEIEEDVREQVHTLTGLNQQTKGLYRDENLFEDADLQMAAYAAALEAAYPGRTVEAALLYTQVPMLLEIPAELLAVHKPTLSAAQ